ncbi:hypothetical protein GY24_05900 [Microterricola pindariensis]|uniref:Uncharacterized protein n=1 Tax=Microterricola pindariensis TaxID=478010 RepID=A0ABX5AX43_9MICO|nr:hypothetical protein GY24_05900 [Microterricola pindariensis]
MRWRHSDRGCDGRLPHTGHAHCIGYKFQKGLESETEERHQALKDCTFNLMYELYANEEQYTQGPCDGVGPTEDVTKFLHDNANKALMGLGDEPMFRRRSPM